ncbi:MAG TPA: prenyltransferase [Thermoanaerobaculia bacterium]|nr:prenyltransferase [Thermoanaerobaculia bacterium]
MRRRPLPLWFRALVGVPRVDATAWSQAGPLSRWLVATRAGVLVITLLPCLVAGLFAYRADAFHPWLWTLTTLGLLLAHATNNLLNDLTDFVKGVDRGSYFRARYGTQPLEQGLITVRQSSAWASITGALALAIGFALFLERGPLVLWLTAIGAFFVLFYTWPLKYIGLGEVAVLAVWGPLMIGGTYFVVTGAWSRGVVLASFVYALGATSVLFGKHIDKLDEDRAKRIRTLPVLLGERHARAVAMALMVLPYPLCAALVLLGVVGPAVLLVLFAVPKLLSALRVFSKPRPASAPAGYPAEAWPLWFVSFAFVHNRAFGAAFVLGLVLDVALVRWA